MGKGCIPLCCQFQSLFWHHEGVHNCATEWLNSCCRMVQHAFSCHQVVCNQLLQRFRRHELVGVVLQGLKGILDVVATIQPVNWILVVSYFLISYLIPMVKGGCTKCYRCNLGRFSKLSLLVLNLQTLHPTGLEG